jgi:membrane protein
MISLMREIIRTPGTQDYAINFIEDFFHNHQTGLLSIGFVLAFYYSSNALMVIIRTFDRSLHKQVKPKFFRKRLRALRLTSVMMTLFIATIFLLLAQGIFFKWLMNWLDITDENLKWFIQILRWVAILSLFFYAIGFIYKYAPSTEKKWKLISPGTIVATFLTLITTFLFTIWVEHFNRFNELYGSIGTTLLIMLLVYLNSYILLLGFELNVSIDFLRSKADERVLTETNGLESTPNIANLDSSK